MNETAKNITQELIDKHNEVVVETQFKLYGLQWHLSPGVYAPSLTQGAALYIDWIEFPNGGAFCEIGCGTGYISVIAAKKGCNRVVASDIDSAAVQNTQKNVDLHGIGHVVDVRESDLFSNTPDEMFDVIFWNSSFIDSEKDRISVLNTAINDPGYENHLRFISQASNYLVPYGRILIGFTDMGDLPKLEKIARTVDMNISVKRAAYVETQHGGVTFQLLEVAHS